MFSVLYVDDERGLLTIGKLFLEQFADFSVDTHDSAREALDSLKSRSYDAIVSDYQMPEMDGIEFLRAVRTGFGDLPFILFTGRGREEVVIEAINNGADFYLQKGGDPTAQFTELAHKIRQAVGRRRAELSLIESEKRLSDIINFLPDATFAIDKGGTVIAWNHAIEEMTGFGAPEMIGKGNYEYAIPFYDQRRPVLVDLIFQPEEKIGELYTNIVREGNSVTAETDLPHPRGNRIHVLAKVSPLYNRQGEVVGAIESIRDITQRFLDAERLAQKTRTLSAINRIIRSSNLQKDIEEPIRTVLTSTLDLLHYDGGGVYLVDDARRTARIVCTENLDPAFVREVDNIDIRQAPFDTLFMKGEPVITEDFDTILQDAAEISGFRSVASIPIVTQEVVFGALNVASKQRRVVDADDLEILLSIGKELGNALMRMKAEIALRESEEKYRSLVTLAPVAVLVHQDGKIVFANPECVRLTGAHAAEELTGRDILPFIHPDDRTKAQEHFALIRDTGATIPLQEEKLLKLDGSPFTVETVAKPVLYGGLPSIIVVFRDITEQKQARDELKAAYEQLSASEGQLRIQLDEIVRAQEDRAKTEKNFRNLVDNAPDAIYIQTNNRFRYLNNAALRLLGAGSAEELLGKDALDRIHPSLHDIIRERIRNLTVDRRPVGLLDEVYIRMDGTPVDVEVSAVPVQYEGEHGALVMVRDVSSRKRTETELRAAYEQLTASDEELRGQYDELASAQKKILETKQQLEEITSTIPGVVFQFYARPDGQMGLFYVNEQAGRSMFGFDESGVDFFPWFTGHVHPEDRQRFMESIEDVVKRAAGWSFEGRFVKPTGEIVWFQGISSPVAHSDNLVYSGVLLDITGRKEAELALRESEARFRAIFEKSHDSLVLFREDRCIDCNRQALELYGYASREEFLGLRPADLSPEFQPDGQDSGSSAAAHTRTVFENGSDHFEWLHQRKDGTTFLADVLLSAFELDRKPVFLSSVRDITERKRMEEELTLLKISVDNAYDEVFWLDFSGNILYVNDSACRITGYSREELSAMKVFELDPDFSPETWEKAVAGLREQKTNFRITRHRKKDGGIIDVEIATVYVKRDGREYSFAFVRDITGRRLAEQNVQTTLAFLNALIDQNPDPVWISDEKGVLIRLNAACCRLLHCTEEDVVGKYNVLKDNIVEEQGFMPLVKSVFEQGRAVSFPLTYDSSRLDAPVLKQTVSLTLEVTIFPIKDAAGTVTNAVIIHNDITERKRIEDALRINEEKFRALVETTSDFIWEVDTEGRYTYVSPQVRDMLGYEPGELEGRTPFDLMPPDEARRVFAEFDRCVRSRSPITSLENAVLRKDGSVVVLETSGVVRTGKDGSYQGYRGIDRDISRRKRAEQALKESEARLQSIMEGSPILQFVIDRNHRVIFWNKAIEEYSGIPAADIIGTSNQWRAFYPEKRPILVDLLLDGSPEDLSRWYGGNLRKSRYVEGACEATGFFSHMGTSGIWLAFTAAPIRDASGTVIGAIETLEDVTERMNAEKALQESEEWSRTILTTAQAGIILVDAATHLIIDANPKALEMIGLPRESVAGRACHRFICPAEEGKCPVSNLGLNMDTSERVLLTATGSRIPVLKTVKPVTVGGRNILVESFVDISEQKRTEAAIQEANRKLNLLNSITRHDVANQLTILQGYAQIAAMKKPDPVVADFLEKIQAAAGTISRQIEFTRMYQEMGVRAPVWTRIDGTITRAYSIPIRFSDRCKTIEIYADPMIEQVFSNLVDNTIRHGSGATEIAVRCEPAPEGIVIFVEDNGLGIATAEKERIFEKGYGKNTGFGLFLVREILAITGITIRETGIPGKGARFEISVPQSAFRVV